MEHKFTESCIPRSQAGSNSLQAKSHHKQTAIPVVKKAPMFQLHYKMHQLLQNRAQQHELSNLTFISGKKTNDRKYVEYFESIQTLKLL